MWNIEAAFDALPQYYVNCNKYLKPKLKYYNAFTYWAFMEIHDLYSSRKVKLLTVDAHPFYHYTNFIFSCRWWVLFLSLNLLLNCPLAMIFNLFGLHFTHLLLTCYINTCLKWADSGLLEMDWLPDDNLMNFCIYECCNWGCTSLLINYNWWKCGMGDGSLYNEARWHRYHLIKKCFDKGCMYPNSQT